MLFIQVRPHLILLLVKDLEQLFLDIWRDHLETVYFSDGLPFPGSLAMHAATLQKKHSDSNFLPSPRRIATLPLGPLRESYYCPELLMPWKIIEHQHTGLIWSNLHLVHRSTQWNVHKITVLTHSIFYSQHTVNYKG